MIFGVALVAQEMNKGPRLVFRYPDHKSDYLQSRILSLLANTNQNDDPKASKSNPKAYYVGNICSQYENLSNESFAKLFKEKLSFMGRTSEFSIEDIIFTSYAFPAQHLSVDKETVSTTGNKEMSIDVPQSQPLFSSFTFVLISINPVFLKSIFPDLILASHQRSVSLSGENPLNCALARRTQRPAAYCNAALKRIVETLGAALAEQERKCNYISDETSLLLRCQERNRRSVSGSFTSTGSYSAPSPIMFQEEYILVPDFEAADWNTPMNTECNSYKQETQNTVSFSGDLTEIFDGDDDDDLQQSQDSMSQLQSYGANIENFVAITEQDEARYNAFLQCLLANELRVFFHAVTGGRAFHFRLHHTSSAHAKLLSIHFVCKEPNAFSSVNSHHSSAPIVCEETLYFANAEADFRRMKPTIVWTSESSTRRARSTNAFMPAQTSTVNPTMSSNTSDNNNSSNSSSTNQVVAQPLAQAQVIPSTHVNFVTLLLLAETDVILETLSSVSGSGPASTHSTTQGEVGDASAANPNLSVNHATSQFAGKMTLSNTRIKDFIESADPTKSMLDLAVILDEPIEELLSMAHYLQHLGLAELVPVLHRRSVFSVHSQLHTALAHTSATLSSGSYAATSSSGRSRSAVIDGFQNFLTHLARVHLSSVSPGVSNGLQTPQNTAGYFKGVTLAAVLAAFDGQRSLDDIIMHCQQHANNLQPGNQPIYNNNNNGGSNYYNTGNIPGDINTNVTNNSNNQLNAVNINASTGHGVWPVELCKFIVPVVLFLLRWHLIQPVDFFLLDTRQLFDEVEVGMEKISNERKLFSMNSQHQLLQNNNSNMLNRNNEEKPNAGSGFGFGRVPMLHLNNIHGNVAGGGSTVNGNSSLFNSNNFQFNNPNMSQYEWSLSRLIQQELNSTAININNASGSKFVSSRSLGEIAVLLRVSEMDIMRALRHLSHVKVVTKPIVVQHL